MSLTIQLPKFEGPMALLLYLIRKEEMDIMDIKIHLITAQYLEYIKMMKEFDLEVAGEFISMASTLIHIKSRMLLPTYNENGEVIEQEDPRKELVQRLLEYQKYQEASRALYERPLLGRDIFVRGIREKLEAKEDEIILEENALFSLISSYRNVLKSIKKKVHQVAAKAQSIASRILELKDRLIMGTRVTMNELLDQSLTAVEEKRRQVLITFLSLLELGKLGFISLYQTETYQDIYIETKKVIETNAIDRVEEYDSLHSEEVAARMMDKAENVKAIEASLAEADDFLLPDEKDEDQLVLTEVISEDEMASDEEILAAEADLEKQPESVVAKDLVDQRPRDIEV
jgi:segregation and condensation protein A